MKASAIARHVFATVIGAGAIVSASLAPRSASGAEPEIRIAQLTQGWSEEDRKWFYSVNQGSRLVPYEWFLSLEMADSEKLFNDASHIEELHYLSRPIDSATNPDGLPIGFVKDQSGDPRQPKWLGLTCAACHTSQINYDAVGYRIDGGPGHGDVQRLLLELADALQKTHDDDQKFRRFADRVLGPLSTPQTRVKLRQDLKEFAQFRREFNKRNFQSNDASHSFGYGRIDAFGIIMNEVLSHGLGIAENAKPPNAPVSIPFLWDTPHHDKVQWNGSAPNRPGGTHIIGPLGRNVGEVLGVFGTFNVALSLKPGYESSVNAEHLFWIEQRLKKLNSPVWPAAFPELDPLLVEQGHAVFRRSCVRCHAEIDRDDPRRQVKAVMTSVKELGTDPAMATNVEGRRAKTGSLEGRSVLLLGARFGDEAPARDILRHVISGVIRRAILDRAQAVTREETAKLEKLRSLPDRSKLKDLLSIHRLSDLEELASTLKELHLERVDDLKQYIELAELLDLTEMGPRDRSMKSLDSLYAPTDSDSLLAYKGRPLNGIWATAPYLHNGSVPNLDQLLRPAARRAETFTVGSREFDPKTVGFKSDLGAPGAFVFRVKDEQGQAIPGNSNKGHEYGSNLSDDERLQLLEYLKSI